MQDRSEEQVISVYTESLTLNCICLWNTGTTVAWKLNNMSLTSHKSVSVHSFTDKDGLQSKLTIKNSNNSGRLCCSTEERSHFCVVVKFFPPPEIFISVAEYHFKGQGLYQVVANCTLRMPTLFRRDSAQLTLIVNNSSSLTANYPEARWNMTRGGMTLWFAKQQISAQVYVNCSLFCRVREFGSSKISQIVTFRPTLPPPTAVTFQPTLPPPTASLQSASVSLLTTIILASIIPASFLIIVIAVFWVKSRVNGRQRSSSCVNPNFGTEPHHSFGKTEGTPSVWTL